MDGRMSALARRILKLRSLQLGLRHLSGDVTSVEEPPMKLKVEEPPKKLKEELPMKLKVEEPSIKLKPSEDKSKKILQSSVGSLPRVGLAGSPSIFLDTHEAVVKLQNAGYSSGEAEAMVKLLVDCQTNSVAPLHAAMVARQDLEIAELRMRSQLEDVHHQLVMLENTKLESVQNEVKSVREKVERLMGAFKEEVDKVQSNLQLDLNLEKGRIKDEATVLRQEVKDTNNRIDREVADIRMLLESQKLESIKYFSGVTLTMVTVVLSVVLGLYRLLK